MNNFNKRRSNRSNSTPVYNENDTPKNVETYSCSSCMNQFKNQTNNSNEYQNENNTPYTPPRMNMEQPINWLTMPIPSNYMDQFEDMNTNQSMGQFNSTNQNQSMIQFEDNNGYQPMNQFQNTTRSQFQDLYDNPFMNQYSNQYSNEFINQYPMQYPPASDRIDYNSRRGIPDSMQRSNLVPLYDYGPEPFVINIDKATKQNNNFRTTIWTGDHLQVTLMSLDVGEDIGVEIHPNVDQFIRVEEGEGVAMMGNRKDRLRFQQNINEDFAVIIPAGTYHNILNTGNRPLKIYSIYAPPQHPHGTVHETKEDAQASE